MANNKHDDWEDVPLDEADDWQDVSDEPSFLSNQLQNVAPALETAQDFATGTAKGLTMGTMDELGGLISAGLETGAGALGFGPGAVDEQLAAQGFDVPQESFLQKYRGYQQASETAQEESADRSPIADIAGQVGGGMLGGHLLSAATGIGAAAKGTKSLSDIAKSEGALKALGEAGIRGTKGYAKSLPLLIPELAASSEKQVIGPESDIPGLAKEVGSGLAFGLPVMLGLHGAEVGAGKVSQKAEKATSAIKEAFQSEEHPRLRQMAKAFEEYGQNLGIHPRSHGQDIAGAKFALRDQKATGSVLETLNSADAKLGQAVGDSLQQATQRGAIIDVSPDIQAAADSVADLATKIPQLGTSRRSAAAYEKMLAGEAQLNPLELKTLIDDIDASIGVLKSATNITPQDAATLNELFKFRSNISDTLKKNVVEYRDAAERFENFRQVLEQVVSRDRPADVTGKFYGKLNDADNKIYGSLEDMIRNVQRDDAASQPARTSFVNFMDKLQDFETKEARRIAANPKLQQVAPNSAQIRKFILDASDDSVLRGSSRATTQGRSLVPDLKEAVIGKAPTSGAFYAGRIAKKAEPVIAKTAAVGKAIYNAPAQSLSNLASRLETSGQFQNLGKALKESLESGNTHKKNAALFTIMQNPNARLFIDEKDLESEEKE